MKSAASSARTGRRTGFSWRLPLPSHTVFVDVVACQAMIEGCRVVTRRNMMRWLASHRPSHPTILLKSLVARKPELGSLHDPRTRLGEGGFAPGIDDAAQLAAMRVSPLLVVSPRRCWISSSIE